MRGRTLKRHTQHNQHVQHVVHANGEVTTHTEATVSYKVPQSAAMQRKRLLLVVGLVILAVGIFFGIRFFVKGGLKNSDNTAAIPSAEVSAITQESIEALNGEDGASYDKVIEKINATSGAESNPTFLYIKLNYYVSISDAKNARKTYDALVKTYDKNVGYDPLINESATSLDKLKTDVEFLENQAKQIDKNGWGNNSQ